MREFLRETATYQCRIRRCESLAVRKRLCGFHFQQWDKNRREHCVYAVLAQTSPLVVKLGFSTDFKVRFGGMKTDSPVELQKLGTIPGSQELEKSIHKMLDEYRSRGEWFFYRGDVKKLADSIAHDDLDIVNQMLAEFALKSSMSFEEKLAIIDR